MPTFRLDDLAQRVGGEVRGRGDRLLRGVAPLDRAEAEELSFLTNRRYLPAARETAAGAVLVGPGVDLPDRDLLACAEPYVALSLILPLFHPPRERRPGVDPSAVVAGDAAVGRDVSIGAFAVIGAGCRLGNGVEIGAGCVLEEECAVGDDSRLMPRVVLYPGTRIGSRCLIHAGAVLGADGFGFATTEGRHRKVPQVGRVVVEDDVEIGANSTIDRAMLGETRIGQGSKLDDQVMVAHGVQVGPHALLAAQSGIAGSTRLGHHATFAGQSGAAGHLAIGDGCIVAAKSAVFEDLPDGAFVAGIPAVHHTRWKRSQIAGLKLPDLLRAVGDLRRRLRALERESTDREE